MGRYENAAIFRDTEAMCKAHPRLKEAIALSRTSQRLILENDKVVVPIFTPSFEQNELVPRRIRCLQEMQVLHRSANM